MPRTGNVQTAIRAAEKLQLGLTGTSHLLAGPVGMTLTAALELLEGDIGTGDRWVKVSTKLMQMQKLTGNKQLVLVLRGLGDLDETNSGTLSVNESEER